MKKLFAALAAATVSCALLAQTAQVVPQFGLDKAGNPRRVTVIDPTKAGADKMVPIGTLDAGNVFTPAFVSGSNIKTVGGVSLLGAGDIGTLGVAYGGTGATTATGTGATVRSNAPTLVAPNLGTPSTAVLTNATALPLTTGVTGTLPVANGGTGVTSATGTGSVVLSNGATLVSPALGTPASGVATNLTGTASGLTAGTVTTNANLTGVITSIGNATSIASQTGAGTKIVVDTSPVLVTPNLGTPSAAVLTNATGLPLTTAVTGTLPVANGGTGVTSATGTGSVVLSNGATLVAPALGTPASGVATNLTGTAAGLTAGTVTTNANLTGVITSIGNATSIASQTGTGTKFVVDTSPTLVTPNLGTPSAAVLTNATGLPLTAGVTGTLPVANGGTGVTAATGTGSVVLNTNPSLSGVTLASGTVAATPTASTDIANKAYVDGAINGLSVKNSVDLATAAALPANSYSNGSGGVGATLTGSATGTLTIDGQTAALNDRVLVKNEASAARNGIFVLTTAGAPGVAYVLTRSTDSDAGSELKGAFTFVEKGTVNASTGWANTNSSTITVGTTAVNFSQFSGAGTYLAGTALNLTGSTFSLADTTVTPAAYALGSFTVDAQGRLTAATSAATTGTGSVVLSNSPTLVAPALGTPASGVATNLTGTASGLTAGTVTTNANLTGVITSIGNATSITSQTGTGTKLVVDTSPTLVTPNLGTPSAGVLTNATGLPIGTGLSGLGAANRIPYATSATALTTGSTFLWNGTTLSVGTTVANASYAAIVKRATDANFGIGLQGSELAIEAFNDALNANVPLRMYASTLGLYTGGSSRIAVDANGLIGVGGAAATGYNLRMSKTLTGSTTMRAFTTDSVAQSDVTGGAYGYISSLGTAAASFTLPLLQHFRAEAPAFGAGSTVGSQYGYFAASSLTGATNNYGFYSDIAAGTNRWNFFANGTAANYFGGRILMGFSGSTIPSSIGSFLNLTGNVNTSSFRTEGNVLSDVTNSATGFYSVLGTQNASFTLPGLGHFIAEQATFGASSTVTNQYGYLSSALNIGATNNYAFHAQNTAAVTSGKTAYGYYSALNTASGGGTTWAFYGQGTAPSYLNGPLGFGTTTLTGYGLRNQLPITGGTTAYNFLTDSQVSSDVTSAAIGYGTALRVQNAAFTLGSLYHFQATAGTVGASATVTNQFGFFAGTNLTAATNNYGFYGNIPAATGRYNFFAAGTAPNYFAGSTGFGSTSLTGYGIRQSLNITGAATAYGIALRATVASDVTGDAYGMRSWLSTQAASFALNNLWYFEATQETIGAGSSVTTQAGFRVGNTLTGATNNYAFRGEMPAGTGRWNFYAAGTAPNYFAGDMQFDKTITAAGTTGAVTIDKNAGSVNFAAAATSVVVTNSRVTANSVVMCTVAANDNTLKSVACVPGSGSFTMVGNAAANAETRVSFLVVN